MYFLCATRSSNEHYSGDCDYALVEINANEARALLEKLAIFDEMKAKVSDTHEIYFWGGVAYSVEYFSSLSAFGDDFELEHVDQLYGSFVFLTSAPKVEAERTECEQVVVTEYGVKFFCYPRHSGIEITTEYIDKPVLETIAAGGTEFPGYTVVTLPENAASE